MVTLRMRLLIYNKQRLESQGDRHAGQEANDYKIALDKGHEMFISLRKSDKLALWARAMYQAWIHRAYEANIRLQFEDVNKL